MNTPGPNLPLLATAANCAGRTFVITGANTGLGYQATKHLVTLGAARVIIAVRNLPAGEKAKKEIEAATGRTGVIDVWDIDLESYDSVKAFAKRAATDLDRIDALVQNAGVFLTTNVRSGEHHLAVKVNVFSTFLLTVLLLPKLRDTAGKFGVVPHVSILASSMGFYSKEEWDSVKEDPLVKVDAETENIMKIYPITKIIDILLVRHLAPMMPVASTGVVMNAICPGLCGTELSRHASPEFAAVLAKRMALFGRTAEEGSRCLLHGMFAGTESHGRFLESCRIAEDDLPAWLTGEEGMTAQERCGEALVKELESVEPGCLKKILE
ncbi:related to retinol dehydrogenase 14 [Cephalotrichum gorgonifer]|uniref:Related to retinol dehydrogenase 14 n=1 Tax=Cephalotrichum gorgonifer TaxID=2041049 RepID=A0AAE8MYT2_9PEZI|nr:related to retinol dehydrogenase 14 [Cephalotrichum gorgonifer]